MINPLSKCTLFVGIFLTLLSIAVPLQVIAESNIPDYYDEPGSSPFRETDSGLQNDSVDPFGGQLTVKNIDLFLPGNGGLDLEIIRNYSIGNSFKLGINFIPYVNGNNPIGVGWDIHLGRVWYGETLFPGGCKSNQVATGSNPVLELPDGSRQVLVNGGKYWVPENDGDDFDESTNKAAPDYVTKSAWSATCIDEIYTLKEQDYRHGGMEIRSPEGLIYKLNYRARVRAAASLTDLSSLLAWGVTEIRDPRGNWIKVDYRDNGWLSIEKITTSDGREVEFEYDETNYTPKLLAIHVMEASSKVQTVHYEHEGVHLTKVIQPHGVEWDYTYFNSGTGRFLLESITNPYGGITEYTYQNVYFESAIHAPTKAVQTRTNKRLTGGVFAGYLDDTWTYEFIPGSPYDTTIIDGPTKVERYQHFGVRGAVSGSVWQIGLLHQKEIFSTGTDLLDEYQDYPIQLENYEWTAAKISEQNEFRPSRSAVDTFTHMPLLASHMITREGSTPYKTEYGNYDVLGKPGVIIETGQGTGPSDVTKLTSFGYYTDFLQWMHLPSQENIQDVGVTFRNYRDDGLLKLNPIMVLAVGMNTMAKAMLVALMMLTISVLITATIFVVFRSKKSMRKISPSIASSIIPEPLLKKPMVVVTPPSTPMMI